MDWPSMEEVQEDGMGQHPLFHMGQHQTQGGEAETRQMNTEDNLRYWINYHQEPEVTT